MTITWPGWCSLHMPDGWVHEDDTETISIFRQQDGVGALQLSFVRRIGLELHASEAGATLAKSYAKQRGWLLDDDSIRITIVDRSFCAEFEYVELGDDSTYWQVWHIVDSTRLVFATYLCAPSYAGIECEERKAIIASLRWQAGTGRGG